jgi:2-methylaconitate cis-trans-isomerase PrpF
MALLRVRAVFMRGGTSKALVFRETDLPPDRASRDAIFLAAMGVPDPAGRNLDGMGGGLSSLNKVCVVGPPSRAGADVDYTFVQLGVNDPVPDYGGNCGNMSSAIGPFAIEEGLVPCPTDGEATVVIHNTNTGKLIHALFPVEGGALTADGAFALDGVAGTAAPVRLEFLEPGGARTGALLPTGKAMDHLAVDGRIIEASLIDAANPCVFVRAGDVGKIGTETPAELEADAGWLGLMEALRLAGATAMGLPHGAGVPKVAMLSAPADQGCDIAIRMISVGQPHRAVPITGAVCLAVAARVPGSNAHALCSASEGPIRIGHASGTTTVDALVELDGQGIPFARLGAVYRSARRLMEGNVLYRLP